MARIDSRKWAGVALIVVVLGYVGCTSSSTTKSSSPSPSPSSQRGPAGAPGSDGSPLQNLGGSVALLVVSGEQDNYLEPCGCTEGQVGGLLRRYDLIERLHGQNWPTVQIDLGSLTKDPAVARGGFDQAKIKFDHAIKALKLQNYSAMALSAEDLKVGVGEALALFLNGLGETTKIVVANIPPPAGYETIFRSSLVATAGPVKLGITAVTDPEAIEKLVDPDKESIFPTIKIQRPDDVLPGVLSELEPKSDYQVLMVQGPPELARRLAGAYPGFDIVVSTSDFVDVLNHEAEPLNGGKTMLVSVGKKGKYVGVFGFYPKGSQPPKYQVVTLNTRFNGPATPMKKLIEDEYRDTLRQVGVVENFPRRDYVNGAPGATFVGAESCKSCHLNTYMKWSTTKHAEGYTALLHDPKPNCSSDAECVSCHTTGFEYTSGWRSESETPYLKGNQCENCHGPGSKHVLEPDNEDSRKVMALTSEQAEKNRLCIRCHDGDNSPKFEFAPYYGRIIHKGLDTYDDPKVHRGFTPKLARTKPTVDAR